MTYNVYMYVPWHYLDGLSRWQSSRRPLTAFCSLGTYTWYNSYTNGSALDWHAVKEYKYMYTLVHAMSILGGIEQIECSKQFTSKFSITKNVVGSIVRGSTCTINRARSPDLSDPIHQSPKTNNKKKIVFNITKILTYYESVDSHFHAALWSCSTFHMPDILV